MKEKKSSHRKFSQSSLQTSLEKKWIKKNNGFLIFLLTIFHFCKIPKYNIILNIKFLYWFTCNDPTTYLILYSEFHSPLGCLLHVEMWSGKVAVILILLSREPKVQIFLSSFFIWKLKFSLKQLKKPELLCLFDLIKFNLIYICNFILLSKYLFISLLLNT